MESCSNGTVLESPIFGGGIDDYAFMIRGLITLYELGLGQAHL